MIEVDTREYLAVLSGLIEEGNGVMITVAGTSMTPFLRDRKDEVFLIWPEQELKKGDIVLYLRSTGQYVLHRICRIKNEGYYMIGDSQSFVEGPIKKEQIQAVVSEIWKDGRKLSKYSMEAWFYRVIWIRIIPVRRILFFLRRILRRIK